jgi:pimeloyl-ACP methyl ester carboxylesterase
VSWSDAVAPVDLWYGERDHTAPPAFGRWWEAQLPHATLHLVADAGHLVALTHWAQILRRLVD